ncbi:MAG: hypothetical protein IPJ19_11995 [Planctomycetes bacterium]|nr:hypothetical protein [Planctomycetota bacterium]
MFGEALGLAVCWLLSAAVLFLPQQNGWERELSPVALALLPWLVWATLPRSRGVTGLLDRLAPALAAPLAVLALALERARGHALAPALASAAAILALAVLFALAAERDARSVLGRRVYAVAWFALVAGAPLAVHTLESAGAPLFGRASNALALAAQLSPLSWWLGTLRAGAGAGLPWIALALGAALWLVGRALEARP